MTVMLAEQSAGAAEAGAAEASSGASSAMRSRPRPATSARARPRSGRPAPRPRPEPAAEGSSRQGGTQRQAKGRRVPKAAAQGQDRTSYQAVVLAEFVAAVLLVAATPFAKKQSDGVSPYAGADMVSLAALTLVYFLLALLSGANRGAGRFAAWFGALVLLTVGLGEAARLAKLLNVFGLTAPAAAGGQDTTTAGSA